jgi:hypothetical protein
MLKDMTSTDEHLVGSGLELKVYQTLSLILVIAYQICLCQS